MKENKLSTLIILIITSIVFVAGCASNPPNKLLPAQDTDGGRYNTAYIKNDVSICNGISDNSLKERCIGEMSGNFERCLNLVNTSETNEYSKNHEKDNCIWLTAFKSNSDLSKISWCNKVFEQSIQNLCKAIISKDTDNCLDTNQTSSIPTCVEAVAEKTGDINVCENFNYAIMKDDAIRAKNFCYIAIVRNTKDHKVCDRISDEFAKKICKTI